MPAPNFKEIQLQLAAHFRDPQHNQPPPGLENKRLDIYRSLFFNNIVNFISSGFPVLRKFYTEDGWRQLIRKFYSQHKSHSPYFAEVAKEFVHFLDEDYQPEDGDPLFITELSHYEWAELALSVADPEINWEQIDRTADFAARPPVLSPLAWHFTYHWPVHQLSPDYTLETPPEEPTYLILCRNQADKINFLRINKLTYQLLQTIEDNPDKNGIESIEAVIQCLQIPNNDTVIAGALQTLTDLFSQSVILGVRRQLV